jgi:hypothetical protein
MKKLILTVTDQETLLEWAASRVGGGENAHFWGIHSEALGCVDAETGKIRAVLVVNGFIGRAAVIHIASDGTRSWATRDILGGMFGYVFFYKNLQRIIGVTPEDNHPALSLALKLGFKLEGRLRGHGDDTGDILTSMWRTECEWLHDPEPEPEPEPTADIEAPVPEDQGEHHGR